MIAPRNAAAIASLVVLCGSWACTNFYEIPIETPIQPKMDVSSFNRVLVAGFIGGGTEDVDANLETVRLLRSQLRTKSNLRVIEAEVLPLVEMARDQVEARGCRRRGRRQRGASARSSIARARPQPVTMPQLRTTSRASVAKRTSNATTASSRTWRSGRRSARNIKTR